MTKYRNKPIVVDGERFDSQAEYSRWRLLDMHQKEGRITNLQRQVPFMLAPSVQIAGKGANPLRYATWPISSISTPTACEWSRT